MKGKRYLFTALLLTALALVACGSPPETATEKHEEEEDHGGGNVVTLTAEQVELMKIETAEPELRQLSGYITAPAKIEAIPTKIADIGTLISGRITRLYVHEGDRVKAGQVLLEIQGLEIGEIKGEFIRTQAALRSAEANFKRQERLLDENIAAEKAYIDAKATYEEATAAFSAADQKLHSIGISDQEAEMLIEVATSENEHDVKAQTATLKVQSPIAGVVSNFKVKLGQLIDPDTDMMEVLDISKVWVFADIYEKNLNAVKSGQRVEVMTEAYPQDVLTAKLEFISSVVDEETRTVKVRATLENTHDLLKPDMFATMRIFGTVSEAAIIVPEAAVQNDGESDFVFVYEPAGEETSNNHVDEESDAGDEHAVKGVRYRKALVQTGIRQAGFVEIKAGLNGAETIVVKGAFFLKSELMKESFGEEGH